MNGLIRKSILIVIMLSLLAYVGYKAFKQILHGFNKYHFIDTVELTIETSSGEFSGEVYGKAFRGIDRPFEPMARGNWEYPNHLREVILLTSEKNLADIQLMTFKLDTFTLTYTGDQLSFAAVPLEIKGQTYDAWKLEMTPEQWPQVSSIPYLNPILNWRGDYHFLQFALSTLFSGAFFFVLKLVFFFLLFPVIIYRWLKARLNGHLDGWLVFALASIFSLLFTNLLLYYLFILFPGSTELFYISVVFASYFALYFPYRKEHREARRMVQSRWANWKSRIRKWEQLLVEREEYVLHFSRQQLVSALRNTVLVMLAILALWVLGKNSVHVLDGSGDIFEYAATGKAYSESRTIDFANPFYNGPGSFTRHSFHAPGYSLLMTWERLVNGFFSIDEIRWFKVVNLYLALMLLLGVFRMLRKRGEWLAWIGMLALLSSFSILTFALNNHIDMLRLATLCAAVLMAGLYMQKPSSTLSILFGMALGFCAFSHSMNVILALGLAGISILIAPENFKLKGIHGLLVLCCFLLFGAAHYVVDVSIGTGWIFR